MIILTKKEVDTLLQFITNPQEREIVREFLCGFETVDFNQDDVIKGNYAKHELAKKVIDIIFRVGMEIGKHELITNFLNLFD